MGLLDDILPDVVDATLQVIGDGADTGVAVIRRTSRTYIASEGTEVSQYEDFPVTIGVAQDFNVSNLGDTKVDRKEFKVQVSPIGVPPDGPNADGGDSFRWNGKNYTITDVSRIYSGSLVALYILTCQR